MGQSDVTSYGDHEINGKDYYLMMKKIDGVTKSIAMENGPMFIDLASHAEWTDEDFYDLSHMKPQGARKVGNLLYQALEGIIPGTQIH